MLEFFSANTRAVNARRAVQESLEVALGSVSKGADLVLINSCVGHDLKELSAAVKAELPQARVLAASCAGVVGRDGAGESMRDIAVMCVRGEGFTVTHVDGVSGATSFDCGVQLARGLQGTPKPVSMIYLLASGIDIANDAMIAGIESVLGKDITIFGGTSSDQMQGVATYQAVDGQRFQHAAFAVGIWDPSLVVDTQATHGFVAHGEPMMITAAEGNRIISLDGKPAWKRYLERLALPENATLADTIPIGALAEELPKALADEYGNQHVLRVVTQRGANDEMIYSTEVRAGTPLWLTVRDEDLIFRDMDRMMKSMLGRMGGHKPIAVFQTDCLARGRRLFDRIMKEELIQRMQSPMSGAAGVPPWFGMYGFGEYARLGGRNVYHNYTTALAAILRKS